MSAPDVFASLNADWIDTAIVIDAALPLELSGEAVRGRLCLFTDEDGREWAMRPDVTLPAAVDEIARRLGNDVSARAVRYDLPVFRLPSRASDPIEYRQLGFEQFGGESGPTQDAEAFAALVNACDQLGQAGGHLSLGDLSLFPAFVDALDLSDETSRGLKRAFRQEGGVEAFLRAQSTQRTGVAQQIGNSSAEEAAAFVEDVFAMTGVTPVGARTADEIVERLTQRAGQTQATDLTTEMRSLIDAFLAIEGAPSAALEQYRAVALEGELSALAPMIDLLEARLEAMGKAAPELMGGASLSTQFGRRFTYYDGFVFEIARSDSPDNVQRPFAAGGRYDGLLSNLSGGQVSATAVGGALMPHRFLDGQGGAS